MMEVMPLRDVDKMTPLALRGGLFPACQTERQNFSPRASTLQFEKDFGADTSLKPPSGIPVAASM